MLLTCFPALLLTRPAGNGDDNSTLARTLACMYARTHAPAWPAPVAAPATSDAAGYSNSSNVHNGCKPRADSYQPRVDTTLFLPDPTTATTLLDPDLSKAPLDTFLA